MNDTLVALFNSSFSLGLFVGPFASSYIALSTSFTTTTDIEALVCLTFMVLYFTIVWIPLRFEKKKRMDSLPKKREAEIDAISRDSGSIKIVDKEEKMQL